MWTTRSSDGQQWSPATSISDKGRAYELALAVSRGGKARVVFTEVVRYGQVGVHTAFFDGSRWADPVEICVESDTTPPCADQDSGNGGFAYPKPLVAIDDFGAGQILYEHMEGATTTERLWKVGFSEGTFGAPVAVDDVSGDDIGFIGHGLAVSPTTGAGFVSWLVRDGFRRRLRVRSFQGADLFPGLTVVSDVAPFDPVPVMDNDGNATLVFGRLNGRGLSAGDLHVIQKPKGGVWGERVRLESDNYNYSVSQTSTGVDPQATAVVGLDGRIRVAWRRRDGADDIHTWGLYTSSLPAVGATQDDIPAPTFIHALPDHYIRVLSLAVGPNGLASLAWSHYYNDHPSFGFDYLDMTLDQTHASVFRE